MIRTRKTAISMSVSAATAVLLSLMSLAPTAVKAQTTTCPVCEDCNDVEDPGSGLFYFYLFGSIVLILISGLMSGLTVGYMSLDPLRMKILTKEGTAGDRNRAKKVAPLLKQHNLLLVTLVLANSAAAQTLPIFFDKIVPTYVAIILSVTAILFFGEILPQAICTGPNRLAITAAFAWLVQILRAAFFVAAYPVSLLMDRFLGEDRITAYRRGELKELIALHQEPAGDRGSQGQDKDDMSVVVEVENPSRHETTQLSAAEVSIIHGTIDLRSHLVSSSMTAFDDVFMIDYDAKLDLALMADVIANGHSRIPVFRGSRNNVQGYLLIKRLIVIDPEDNRPISQFHSIRKPLVVHPSITLLQLLRKFLKHGLRIALATESAHTVRRHYKSAGFGTVDLPPDTEFVGLITLEDVLERLLQDDIRDEHEHDHGHSVEIIERHVSKVMTSTIGVQRAISKFKRLLRRAEARKLGLTDGETKDDASGARVGAGMGAGSGAGAGAGAGAGGAGASVDTGADAGRSDRGPATPERKPSKTSQVSPATDTARDASPAKLLPGEDK